MKETRLGVGTLGQGLGDLLNLTSICKYKPDCVVEITPNSKRFASLFDGICKRVDIVDNPIITPDTGSGTYMEQKMRTHGVWVENATPFVKLTDEEKENGKIFASQYDNPIIFVPNTSTTWKHVREMEKDKWTNIIYRLKDRYTFLQFGVSSNYTQFDYTIPFIDVPVRTAASFYYGVGKYLGVETGDKCLMSAVGGSTIIVLHPSNGNGYIDHHWQFANKLINYINFKDTEKIFELL